MKVCPYREVKIDLCFNLRNVSLSLVAKAATAPQVNVLSNTSVCRQGCTDHLGGGLVGEMLPPPSWGEAAVWGAHQSSGVGCFPEPLSGCQLEDHPLPAIFTNISAFEICPSLSMRQE